MGLCGCNLKEKLECSNGIHDGKNWHRIRINRSGERQKICRIVAMKIRGNILCSGELGGLCCRWNAYHQNLDMIDEMKHLPGTWIWKNLSLLYYLPFGVNLRSVVCLVTAVENLLVQFVFWSLGPLSKTCLLQKRLHCLRTLHLMVKGLFLSLSVQMCLDSSVSFILLLCRKDAVWFL